MDSSAAADANESADSGQRERTWSVKDVHGKKKIGYIWEYYKFPIAAACIVLYLVGYMVYGHLTHKDAILYTALVNVTVGDDFAEELTGGFLDYVGADRKKSEVELNTGLYVAGSSGGGDSERAYASNVKITASVAGQSLDVVLMDKGAFDVLSRGGFLCNLADVLSQEDPALYEELKPWLVSNEVVLEDNSDDVQPNSAETDTAVTDEYPMGIDLSQSELVAKEGFGDPLYLGIIANTPRRTEAVSYVRYLAGLTKD